MQRLFARVAWRMRGGWAQDVPFVEKFPVIGCVQLHVNDGVGGVGGVVGVAVVRI